VRYTLLMAMLGLITYYVHAFLNNYSQYDKIAVPLWAFTAVVTALDLYHRGAGSSAGTLEQGDVEQSQK
jgi:putative inorganic carbon (HCO3(-)) transporter